jgi:hypothetical protein
MFSRKLLSLDSPQSHAGSCSFDDDEFGDYDDYPSYYTSSTPPPPLPNLYSYFDSGSFQRNSSTSTLVNQNQGNDFCGRELN